MKLFNVIRVGLGIVLGGLLSGGLLANPAIAASIQYSFTGDVNHVQNHLSSQFNTSQVMSGTMTVNTTDTPNVPNTIGTYAIETFSLNIGGIGGYTATMGTSGQVVIRDAGIDRFNMAVNAPVGVPATVNFLAPRLFDFQLRGPSNVFASDALPTTVPSIGSFSNFNRWRLVFGPGNGIVVRGDLTSLTAVPLPAAVILFGAGLVALVGLGAGSWRRKSNSLA